MNPPSQTHADSNRILVVDDERIVLTALRETLRLEGYEVVATSDPLEALDIIQRTRFSVILTDQQMPVLTGLEFLAQAKEVQPNAVRILITAVLSLNTVIDAINKGEIYRFIVKPWLREELLVTVRNAVQRYELVLNNEKLQAEALDMNRRLQEQVDRVNAQNRELERLNTTLHENLDRSVQLCLKTIETFYPVLGGRARRTLELCKAIGEGANLPADQRKILEISAQLHGIGLIGTPRELIRKWQLAPDSLSEAERALIELHPALGQELVGFVADLGPVSSVIRAHRERFDGQGYPDRLSGEQIPSLARLLAVCIGYASSNGDAAGIEAVKSQSGTAYDPDAVRAFLRCLPKAVVPRNQREVLLSELQPGMVLATGIYTYNGVLLIPEGQVLNQPQIDKLKNHNLMSPITQNLVIYC